MTKTSTKGSGNAVYLQINFLSKGDGFLGAFELNTEGNVSGARLNSASSGGYDIYFSSVEGIISETNNGYYISFTSTERWTGQELVGEWEGQLSYR